MYQKYSIWIMLFCNVILSNRFFSSLTVLDEYPRNAIDHCIVWFSVWYAHFIDSKDSVVVWIMTVVWKFYTARRSGVSHCLENYSMLAWIVIFRKMYSLNCEHSVYINFHNAHYSICMHTPSQFFRKRICLFFPDNNATLHCNATSTST